MNGEILEEVRYFKYLVRCFSKSGGPERMWKLEWREKHTPGVMKKCNVKIQNSGAKL